MFKQASKMLKLLDLTGLIDIKDPFGRLHTFAAL